MVELTTLFGLAQTLAIFVGVIIALMELRHMRQTRDTELETRKLQLYSQLVQVTHSSDWMQALINLLLLKKWEDFDDLMSKYGPEKNLQEYASIFTVLEVYQTAGVFLEKEAIDLEMMYRHNGDVAMRVWEKVESFVREFRNRRGSPLMYRSFENLYNELKKYKEQHPELKT